MEHPLISHRDRAPVPFDPSSTLFFLQKGLNYIRIQRGPDIHDFLKAYLLDARGGMS